MLCLCCTQTCPVSMTHGVCFALMRSVQKDADVTVARGESCRLSAPCKAASCFGDSFGQLAFSRSHRKMPWHLLGSVHTSKTQIGMSMASLYPSSQQCTCQSQSARQSWQSSRCRHSTCSAARQDPQPSGRRELFGILGSACVLPSVMPAFAVEELKVKAGQELKPENNKAKSDEPATSPPGDP